MLYSKPKYQWSISFFKALFHNSPWKKYSIISYDMDGVRKIYFHICNVYNVIYIYIYMFLNRPPQASAIFAYPRLPIGGSWPHLDERYLEGRRRHILEELLGGFSDNATTGPQRWWIFWDPFFWFIPLNQLGKMIQNKMQNMVLEVGWKHHTLLKLCWLCLGGTYIWRISQTKSRVL